MKLTWQTDTALALTAVSSQLRAILKLSTPGPILAQAVTGPDSPEDFGIIAHEWALQGERVNFETRIGETAYTMEVEPLYAPDGSIAGVTGTARPAGDLLATHRRSSIFAHAESIAGSGSWYYDALTGECEWSDNLYAMLGADAWMPFSRNVRMYDAPDDARIVQDRIEHARLAHEPYSIDHRIVRADGAVRNVQERGAFFFDEAGMLTHVIGTMLDITERKQRETRLTYLAHHDSLSELPNRVLLEERFTAALERARANDAFCGILFIDIDGFKGINDTLGHGCGDDLLRAVAARLGRHVRFGDTLARLGGDEFVILLDGLTQISDAETVAQTVLETFGNPFTIGHHRVSVAASIGVAVAPPDGTTLQSLLCASDRAMYCAKNGGGNRVSAGALRLVEREMVG